MVKLEFIHWINTKFWWSALIDYRSKNKAFRPKTIAVRILKKTKRCKLPTLMGDRDQLFKTVMLTMIAQRLGVYFQFIVEFVCQRCRAPKLVKWKDSIIIVCPACLFSVEAVNQYISTDLIKVQNRCQRVAIWSLNIIAANL